MIRAIRSAVGPNVAIMVDYNQSLTPTDTVERLRHLEDEGLTGSRGPRGTRIIRATPTSQVKFGRRFSAAKTGGARGICSMPSKRAPAIT